MPERIAAKNLHRVPDGLDLRVAALAEPLGCVVHALDRVDVAEGDRAVVLGAGSLGLMHCALLASAGAQVVVLDPHPERLSAAVRFGAAGTVRAERGPADVERCPAAPTSSSRRSAAPRRGSSRWRWRRPAAR